MMPTGTCSIYKVFLTALAIYTVSEAYSASYQIGKAGYFSGIKAARA
jgi:hypothetical protein